MLRGEDALAITSRAGRLSDGRPVALEAPRARFLTDLLPRHGDLPHPIPSNLWRLIEAPTPKVPARRLPEARSVQVALDLMLR